jgi:hypothetical protein
MLSQQLKHGQEIKLRPTGGSALVRVHGCVLQPFYSINNSLSISSLAMLATTI